jgi:RNA polymerase sigma-70 factor (ECF subfamily)
MSQQTTVRLQRQLDRLKAGDTAARRELLTVACGRLERLARKMLRADGRLTRWEQTDDVLQGGLIRLHRALAEVVPDSPRDFYRLAALQIRRELIDLARHHYGPAGAAGRHDSRAALQDQESRASTGQDRSAAEDEPTDLALWTEFHERIGALPEEQREVFDLVWYQGLTHTEAADLLDVSTKTIYRRWQAACLALHEAMHGEMPRL